MYVFNVTPLYTVFRTVTPGAALLCYDILLRLYRGSFQIHLLIIINYLVYECSDGFPQFRI